MLYTKLMVQAVKWKVHDSFHSIRACLRMCVVWRVWCVWCVCFVLLVSSCVRSRVCVCVCGVGGYLHDICSYNKPQELLKKQNLQQGRHTTKSRLYRSAPTPDTRHPHHTHTHIHDKQMPMCNGAYEGKWQT